MESFIVRIYRQDALDPHQITGTVIKAGEDQEASFTTSDELIDIIAQDPDLTGMEFFFNDPK